MCARRRRTGRDDMPVSLDPPLLSCIQNGSNTWPRLRECGAMGVSVLSREQKGAAAAVDGGRSLLGSRHAGAALRCRGARGDARLVRLCAGSRAPRRRPHHRRAPNPHVARRERGRGTRWSSSAAASAASAITEADLTPPTSSTCRSQPPRRGSEVPAGGPRRPLGGEYGTGVPYGFPDRGAAPLGQQINPSDRVADQAPAGCLEATGGVSGSAGLDVSEARGGVTVGRPGGG